MPRPEPGAAPCGLADDAKHLCPGVGPWELAGHSGRMRAISGLCQNGADSLAESARRRLVGGEIDATARPRNARVTIGLVFRQPGGDDRDPEAHRLIHAAIAAIGDE